MTKIATFWSGPVTWLERLSVNSMRAAGHAVDIYANDRKTVLAAGLDAEIVEVGDLMSGDAAAESYLRAGLVAFYADHVRLELQKRSLGTWSDLDCVFLNPLRVADPENDYVFGWCAPNRVNNAVLRLPARSRLLETYQAALRRRPIRTPWATPHVRLKRELEIMLGHAEPSNPRKLAIGPRALTYFVRKLGLEDRAAPRRRFYPLADDQAELLVTPSDAAARGLISPDTTVVHAWRGKLWSIGASAPPAKSSWLGGQVARLEG